MLKYFIKVRSTELITHNVLRIVTERPYLLNFIPGQAAEISINKKEWVDERRPFTFTSRPADSYLEFTIKIYPGHHGVTKALLQLEKNDELILHDIFGTIAYKEEGVFIAGGAGITPFISILRSLQAENKIAGNKLIFANKTKADIILRTEFENLLGSNFINILSEEKVNGYAFGRISEQFLQENITDLNQQIYLCGPEPMMDAVEQQLKNIGFNTDLVVKEAFWQYLPA